MERERERWRERWRERERVSERVREGGTVRERERGRERERERKKSGAVSFEKEPGRARGVWAVHGPASRFRRSARTTRRAPRRTLCAPGRISVLTRDRIDLGFSLVFESASYHERRTNTIDELENDSHVSVWAFQNTIDRSNRTGNLPRYEFRSLNTNRFFFHPSDATGLGDARRAREKRGRA